MTVLLATGTNSDIYMLILQQNVYLKLSFNLLIYNQQLMRSPICFWLIKRKGFPCSYQCWLKRQVGWQLAHSKRETVSRGSRDILLVPHYYPGIQPTALAHLGTGPISENDTNRAL